MLERESAKERADDDKRVEQPFDLGRDGLLSDMVHDRQWPRRNNRKHDQGSAGRGYRRGSDVSSCSGDSQYSESMLSLPCIILYNSLTNYIIALFTNNLQFVLLRHPVSILDLVPHLMAPRETPSCHQGVAKKALLNQELTMAPQPLVSTLLDLLLV